MSLKLNVIQFTVREVSGGEDTGKKDQLKGTNVKNPKTNRSRTKQGAVFGSACLSLLAPRIFCGGDTFTTTYSNYYEICTQDTHGAKNVLQENETLD